ncbi:MAG TPA: hypothetical protein VI298_10030 [Geobacteraceae bacterium]
MSSTETGINFENAVLNILEMLRAEFPSRVYLSKQPKIRLQNEETVIPDFEIAVDLPHVYSKYLIECQDRKKNSKSIIHKIQYIRSKSNRNKFLFVYNNKISKETERSLKNEGVIVLSLTDLSEFAERLKLTLKATPPPSSYDGGGGDDEWDADVEQEE